MKTVDELAKTVTNKFTKLVHPKHKYSPKSKIQSKDQYFKSTLSRSSTMHQKS